MKNENLKSMEEIVLMRKAGLLVWQAHQIAAELVKPEVTTAEINAAVEQFLAEKSATAIFKDVVGPTGVPFPAATCISVNEQIVHGIPGERRLQEGDAVSIDIGCKLNGWCGDAAVTHAVGVIDAQKRRLLETTEGVLRLAIELIPTCSLWSQVAKQMEAYVKKAGFTVVEGLVGHSIGREMWESPQVPNYFTLQYEALGDFELQPGVVVAIEPMVNAGTKRFKMLSDHWTMVTLDGKPSAHFEHTVAIAEQGVQVLTAGPDGRAWAT
ncbi:MAG: type I methionyl aminopeptidase [Chloroflexi bacterium]|nr:type I methionyl aminopeptidase [Ktedonobacteraceae bacterium]MBV9708587.1 type I methionyl aminopeptidase [Chloroflexota bacterium]